MGDWVVELDGRLLSCGRFSFEDFAPCLEVSLVDVATPLVELSPIGDARVLVLDAPPLLVSEEVELERECPIISGYHEAEFLGMVLGAFVGNSRIFDGYSFLLETPAQALPPRLLAVTQIVRVLRRGNEVERPLPCLAPLPLMIRHAHQGRPGNIVRTSPVPFHVITV